MIAYRFDSWHNSGYKFPEPYDLKDSPRWTDVRGVLPFYFPLGPRDPHDLGKYLEVDGAGLYHLKVNSTRKYLWVMDVYRQDKRKFFKQIQGDFDKVFCAHKDYLYLFDNAKWLPYWVNTDIYKEQDYKRNIDVCSFANTDPNLYPERARMMNAINAKFKLKTGNFRGLLAADYYSHSKIVFNHSGFFEVNLRIFEGMGSGALVITNRLPAHTGIHELFDEDKHIVYYTYQDELIEKIDYYLKHDAEREKIAKAGHDHALANHTLEHRLKKIF